jgi:hypothetical protein
VAARGASAAAGGAGDWVPPERFARCDGAHESPTVFAHACNMGLEGIVSKRKDSAYRSGRSPDWLKMKKSGWPGDEAGSGGGLGALTAPAGAFSAASHKTSTLRSQPTDRHLGMGPHRPPRRLQSSRAINAGTHLRQECRRESRRTLRVSPRTRSDEIAPARPGSRMLETRGEAAAWFGGFLKMK